MKCYLGDASKMELQLDLYDAYFFFNPFSYRLSEIVFKHIIDSLRRKPRKIKIFYAEPICHQLLIDSGYFFVKQQISSSFGGLTYNTNVYESF